MNKNYKELILGTLPVFGTIFYLFFTKLIFNGNFSLWINIIFMIAAFSFMLGLWGISAYLIESRIVIHSSSFISTLVLLIFSPQNYYFYTLFFILFLYFLQLREHIKTEKKARIKVLLDETISPSLKAVLTIICLLFTLGFAYSPSYEKMLNYNISNDFSVGQYEEKLLTYLLPGFKPDITVDDFIYLLMAKSENITQDKIDEYVSRKKTEMTQEQFNDYKNTVLKNVGISDTSQIQGDQKLLDNNLLVNLTSGQISDFLAKYANIIRFSSLISIYIILVYSWKILYPFIYLVVWLIYTLLKNIGFIQIQKEQVEAERVKL